MTNQSSESNAGESDPATATANDEENEEEPAVDHGLGEQDEDMDFVLCRGRKRVRGLQGQGTHSRKRTSLVGINHTFLFIRTSCSDFFSLATTL